MDLLTTQLDELRTGFPVVRPTYDFATHDRAKEGLRIEPAPVIVVEGILVLADERLRSRFEVKLFVDTDSDIRLMRRIRRDSSIVAGPSPRSASSTTRAFGPCISPSSSRRSALPT